MQNIVYNVYIHIYIYTYIYIYVVLCVYAYKYTSQGYVDRSVRAIIKSTDHLSFGTPQTGETSTRGLSILECLDVRGMERSMEKLDRFLPLDEIQEMKYGYQWVQSARAWNILGLQAPSKPHFHSLIKAVIVCVDRFSC